MKKAILFLLPLWLLAEPKAGVVTEINQNQITASVSNAKIGESAIVLFEYLGGKIITKECVVTASDQAQAELDCKRFSQFDQDAMPQVDMSAKVGDQVIVAPLSNFALVIAPSASRYVRVLEREKTLHFIHPDIFAIMLAKQKNPNPNRSDFKQFCQNELVGVVIFALDSGDHTVDCQSFVLQKTETSTPTKDDAMKPFFHRLNKIEKGFFAWLTPKEIKEFDSHYKKLIKKDLNDK